ncbi:Lrp/AsnC family transcriptional regulator [Oceanospirillum linum]|uniref:Transcriptional regulator n=1 Tax=Oceanospirillum linum TaxID=966 RepID=A0A1T1H9D1_OCELI|nr:Lrp/AsnC family transcriptional regulator [Oceanospirillum linum]OOV86425.1 transcriptional regulator [Oceanospirillum linum]SEG33062.1 transcriptional regulator, AsnC family [Oleiphilus messinensis]SMP29068.1 transcriptional regulator, AsnC family [Oceanospirillum linum]
MQLDKISRNILSILQKEARITNQELADRVGLSPSSCLNRVRKLEEAGLIGPYLSTINLPKICRSVEVIVTVSLKDQSTEAFRTFQAAAQSHPEVVECYTVSGSFDFFLRIVAPDMMRYNEINDQLLDVLPGMVNLSSHVVLTTVKPFRGYPLNALMDEHC